MKILVFGDVVGRIGREGMTAILPKWREQYAPDSVIVNVENMAHGRGISPDTMAEALRWKADAYTTGDHAWDNKLGFELLNDPKYRLVRPANYVAGVPGRGWMTYSLGAWQVAVINLQGQVMFKNDPENPFGAIDSILHEPEVAAANIRLIDFHAEATSEKRGFGWHVDGRVSAVWGTHTHVPTADGQVMPKGTGYISDVGMNGGHHSIIGMDTEGPLRAFRTQLREKMTPPESGPIEINAVLFEIDPQTSQCLSVQQLREILPG